MEGELAQDALAARGDADQDDAAIGAAADAANQTSRFEAVEQLDEAVMLQMETLGEVADRGLAIGRSALDGEEQLVVLRLETGGASGLLAQIQEAANLIPELSQGTIFRVLHDDGNLS
jgi:hypothetical protein